MKGSCSFRIMWYIKRSPIITLSALAGFFHVCSPFPSLFSPPTHKELSLEHPAAFGLLAAVVNFNYNLLHGIRDKLNYCYLEHSFHNCSLSNFLLDPLFSLSPSLPFPLLFSLLFFALSTTLSTALNHHSALFTTSLLYHFQINIDIIFKRTSSTEKRQNGSHGKH